MRSAERLAAERLAAERLAAERLAAERLAAERLVVGLLGPIVLLMAMAARPAAAQQKIGYIDSEYILSQMPEFATVEQRIDRLSQQWETEIENKQAVVDTLTAEYQARELIYTDEERQRRRQEIAEAEKEVEQLRERYFGPEGELYKRQKELMRPIQERVLVAVEEVAQGDEYDYVFDKSGEFLFMYAREEHNLSDDVLEELGIDIDEASSESR